MICPSCRRDSKTVDFCQYCMSPLAGAAGSQATTAMAPMRVSLTGEVVAAPAAAPPPDITVPLTHPGVSPQALPRVGAATLSGQAPARSGLATVASTLPAGSITAGFMQQSLQANRASTGERLERFLAMAMPLLTLSVLLLHFYPSALLAVMLADSFIMAMMIGGSTLIPSYDDAYLDAGVAILVSFLFGPLIGLVIYGIVGLVKQEMNAAVVGLLALQFCLRFGLTIPLLTEASFLEAALTISIMNIGGGLATMLSFLGWMLSSFVRPLDQ